MGRKPTGDKPKLATLRQRRWRRKRKAASERAERQTRHVQRQAVWAAGAAKASGELAGLGKLYGLIVADPGWNPVTRSDKGKSRHPSRHYTTRDTDEIAAIQVPAAPDAVLGLWATIQMLEHALHVMTAWGFSYKSAYGWMKPGRGTGYWSAKDQLELLLIGTRGRLWVPPVRGLQPPQVMRIEAPTIEGTFTELLESAPILMLPRCAHSTKPDVFYNELARVYDHPGIEKLEMYARGPRAGWDVWGDEAPGHD